MASISFSTEVSQTGTGQTSWTFSDSDWSEQLKTLAYTNVSKCTLSVQGKGSITSVNNHKMYVYIGSTQIGSNTDVDTSYESIFNSDVISYVNKTGSSAGSFTGNLKVVADRGTLRTSSVKITITWEYTVPTYTINLDANGGTVSETSVTRTSKSAIGTLPTPTREGYTFNYWMLSDGTRIYSTTVVTSNLTVYANWTINNNSITTVASPTAGGVTTGDGTYEYGTLITLTATANIGYKFVKWNDGDTNASRTITVTTDTTYKAYYELVSGTLNVDYQGGNSENNSFSVEYSPEGYASVTLKKPTKDGYKFSGWTYTNNSGGSFTVFDSSITEYYYGTIDGATDTLTAIWKPIYITYDSIFSFQKWKALGITSGNGTISNITATGFALTSGESVGESTSSSLYFPVESGESYKIDIDITGDNWDVYIFFHNETSTGTGLEFSDSTNRFSSDGSGNATRIFTAPEGAIKAQIRVDVNGSSNTVSFNNFRIYPSECDYMGSTVPAEDRSNAVSWDMPAPTRDGYEFIAWNTQPDGSGTDYSSTNSFPSDDMVLYSQWKIVDLPSISSVVITPNPCEAGQGFIISVGFKE